MKNHTVSKEDVERALFNPVMLCSATNAGGASKYKRIEFIPATNMFQVQHCEDVRATGSIAVAVYWYNNGLYADCDDN